MLDIEYHPDYSTLGRPAKFKGPFCLRQYKTWYKTYAHDSRVPTHWKERQYVCLKVQHYKKENMHYDEVPKCKSTKGSLACEDFYKACSALQSAKVPDPYLYLRPTATTTISLGNLQYTQEYADVPKAKQEKETDMMYDLPIEKQYLTKRADRVYDKAVALLRDKFNMDLSIRPKTPKELIEFIKDGKFELNSTYSDEFWTDAKNFTWDSPSSFINNYFTWVDPSKKSDEVGYTAAAETLKTELTALKDVIVVKSADDALKALQDFETKNATKQ